MDLAKTILYVRSEHKQKVTAVNFKRAILRGIVGFRRSFALAKDKSINFK